MHARTALSVAIAVVSAVPLPIRASEQSDLTLEVGASQIDRSIGHG